MYLVFVAKQMNTQKMASVWGEEPLVVSGIEQAVVHSTLKKADPKWSKRVPDDADKTCRIVKFEQDLSEQLDAVNFTGAMEDDRFQVIGCISDEAVALGVKAYQTAELEQLDNMLNEVRKAAEYQLTVKGSRFDAITVRGDRIIVAARTPQDDLAQMRKNSHKNSVEKMFETTPELVNAFKLAE